MKPLSIVSFNAAGLVSKSANFLSLLFDPVIGLSAPDILFLQETHLPSVSEFQNLQLFGPLYQPFHSFARPTDTSAGVAIVIRKDASHISEPTLVDHDAAHG